MEQQRPKEIAAKRGRGGRRKGERRVAVRGTDDLFKLFNCRDVDTLLATLDQLRVHAHVSGFGEQRLVAVVDHQVPVELREHAVQIAEAASGWVG